ncbi:glycine zipper 2TM domain-containing protein [Massilia sp. 9096]|uniref:glycine zipper 2TM domain-containing protein n=1 Tax=Massilia sp. 9096 TaxID=1500894 RepID=UPI0005611966|nr:glycine zipper 2TM domain-containing protein [Massilia sp. 9096]
MNTPTPMNARPRQHPLLLIAALAVILFCAVGIAAVMGWLPSSHGSNRNGLSDADRATLAAGMQPANAPQAAAALPGQPVSNADLPGQPAPAYAANGAAAANGASLAPANGYTPPVVAPAGVPAAAAAAAPAGSAYGYSGNQGSTGSGVAYDNAPSTAYASPQAERDTNPPSTQKPARLADTDNGSRWCASCGNVESIREIVTRARGSGVGAGAGAILGGLLGNQIGSGNGRSLATVAGAVGGAVVGNQVEGNMHANHSYEIRVRLDDGTLRTFHQHSVPQWRAGDRVRVVKGTLRTA